MCVHIVNVPNSDKQHIQTTSELPKWSVVIKWIYLFLIKSFFHLNFVLTKKVFVDREPVQAGDCALNEEYKSK